MTTIRELQTTSTSLRDDESLLTHAIKRDRSFVLAHPEYRLSLIEKLRFTLYRQRRAHGWSIAHISHHKEFFGLNFFVNRHTLIPRPETEILVERVINELNQERSSKKLLIDVGTGSGCIPISILKKTYDLIEEAWATDISRGALRVARHNAQAYATTITFAHGNLLEPFIAWIKKETERIIFLTANLPYLTAKQFAEEPSIRKEPYTALVAEENGLALYRQLLEQLKNALSKKRITTYLFFEIDPSQAQALPALIATFFPEAEIATDKDLNGETRVVNARIRHHISQNP